MKINKKTIINIIVGIAIIFYIIFNSDIVNEINKTMASVANVSDTEEKVEVDGDITVSFIDVGQADSILIRTNGHNMLIDAGNNSDGEKLVSYFNNFGITNFDYVIGTHAHEDHIGGMDDIIENFDIDTFYMPDVTTTTKTFEDVLDAIISKNMSINIPKIDDEFYLDSAKIKIIYAGDKTNDLNDSSIVLKLTYGNNSFLFTGDATSNVEKVILSKDIKADVLKVGHHGSQYSSTNEFLNVVNPKYGVISAGKNNNYGHPTKENLDKLINNNIKIYRTDQDGTIIFTSDGSDISVKTMVTDTNG